MASYQYGKNKGGQDGSGPCSSSPNLEVPKVYPYFSGDGNESSFGMKSHLSNPDLSYGYLEERESSSSEFGSPPSSASSSSEFGSPPSKGLPSEMKFDDVHSSSSELGNIQDIDSQSDTSSNSDTKVPDSVLCDVKQIGKMKTKNNKKFYLGSSSESIYYSRKASLDTYETYQQPKGIIKYLPVKRRLAWVRNNIQSFGFTILFIAINLTLFITRSYEYRHTNFLHIGARACGQCLNFDCAMLLTLILRRSITKIRNSPLGNFLPCDKHVHFHKLAGWTVFLFSIFHTIFHMANFVGMSEETGVSLGTYLWDTSLGIGWLWGLANPTGVVLMIMLIVIVAFSHRCVRKSGNFEIFYWTHLLSLPFWALLVIHGHNFWKWLLIPGSVFVIENLVRIAQVCSSRGRTEIVSSYSFASHVTKLTIRKPKDLEFRAGEYVYLNIPSVAKYEWHPFTISSAPEEDDIFMVHIRAVGGWTEKVYEIFQSRNVIEERPESPFHLYSREKKLSMRGILNIGFDSANEDWKLRGNRYMDNLKEFNRRLSSSMGSYKAMIDDVKQGGQLNRKKSCSMGSLSNSSKQSYKSGSSSPESGRSSLTGSHCSLQGQSMDIQGEPVVFPPSIVVESPDGIKSNLSRRNSNDTKIWMEGTHTMSQSTISSTNSDDTKAIEVYVDGPYGTPSSNIFNVSHAVLIGAGIGVTPFASVLQSVMHRYHEAKIPCPHCKVSSCVALPSTLRKLRKVDFIWVNRDLRHFEWFLELLASIEEEQSVAGAAMEKFLRLHLYKTGDEPLQFPIPLASVIHNGRPDWDKLLGSIRESRVGRVCVYYCGPPSLAGVLREKCLFHHLDFRKEMF